MAVLVSRTIRTGWFKTWVGRRSGRGGLLGPAVAAFMLTFLFNFLTSLGVGEPARLMLQGVLIALAAMAYSARHR